MFQKKSIEIPVSKEIMHPIGIKISKKDIIEIILPLPSPIPRR